jgi:hypothetical protein
MRPLLELRIEVPALHLSLLDIKEPSAVSRGLLIYSPVSAECTYR